MHLRMCVFHISKERYLTEYQTLSASKERSRCEQELISAVKECGPPSVDDSHCCMRGNQARSTRIVQFRQECDPKFTHFAQIGFHYDIKSILKDDVKGEDHRKKFKGEIRKRWPNVVHDSWRI